MRGGRLKVFGRVLGCTPPFFRGTSFKLRFRSRSAGIPVDHLHSDMEVVKRVQLRGLMKRQPLYFIGFRRYLFR